MTRQQRTRRTTALNLLKEQLEKGTKPTKGEKPFKLDNSGKPIMEKKPGGEMGPVRLEFIPLTQSDIAKKHHEIASLEKKLNVTSKLLA